MTIAEIHGKSPNTNSEDVLTADVFTAFRYLPVEKGILGFLRSIPRIDNLIPEPINTATCIYYFWPRGRYREPDLLLELNVDGRFYHVVIEAKYYSGPSDTELVEVEEGEETKTLGNQLADQFRGLRFGEYIVFRESHRDKERRLKSRKEDRMLLYLTAHPMRPKSDLQQAVKLLVEDFSDSPDRLLWSNWFAAFDHLDSLRPEMTDFPYALILEDICCLLSRKGFSSFQGFTALPTLKLSKAEGSFWLDLSVKYEMFTGIAWPPKIEIVDCDGGFWQGLREPSSNFAGVSLPPSDLTVLNSSFWTEREK